MRGQVAGSELESSPSSSRHLQRTFFSFLKVFWNKEKEMIEWQPAPRWRYVSWNKFRRRSRAKGKKKLTWLDFAVSMCVCVCDKSEERFACFRVFPWVSLTHFSLEAFVLRVKEDERKILFYLTFTVFIIIIFVWARPLTLDLSSSRASEESLEALKVRSMQSLATTFVVEFFDCSLF